MQRDLWVSADEFPISGLWWLPADPDHQVRGVLQYTEDGGVELQLTEGTLGIDPPGVGEVVKGHVIFGRDDRSKRAVTVLDAWHGGSRTPAGDTNPQPVVRGHTVLTGSRHPDGEGRFDSCSFSFDGLAEWAAPYFRLITSEFEDGTETINVRYSATVGFDVGDWNFQLFTSVRDHHDTTLRELTTRTHWVVRAAEPVSLDDVWTHAIQPLKYLHILLTAEPTSLLDLTLHLRPAEEEAIGPDLRVHADWTRRRPQPKRRWHEWPIRASEVADRLEEVVSSWIRVMQSAESGIVLLFSVLAQEKEFYLQTRFLTLAQAAEAYHRHHPGFTTEVVPKAEHEARVGRLLESVPPEERKWLAEKLLHSNEPTFRQRLREIRSYVGEFAEEWVDSRALNRIVNFRNDLTHVVHAAPVDDDGVLGQINVAAGKLALLMRAALLRDLGLEPSEVRSALLRSSDDVFISEYRLPRR